MLCQRKLTPEGRFSETLIKTRTFIKGLLDFTNYVALIYILIIQYREGVVKENPFFFRYFFTDYRYITFDMQKKGFIIACRFPTR